MIEHVSLHCKDVKKSRKFYQSALAPLGYRLNMNFPDAAGFMAEGHTSFWVSEGKIGTPTHIAFRARSRKTVEAFYQAALNAGAKDNGGPGLRPENGSNYYAAFVIDPNGHNVEAVTFSNSPRKKVSKGSGKTKAERASSLGKRASL